MTDRFPRLLAPHRADLERYARGMVPAHEVEDLLQDALLRVYRDFARFEEGTSFRAFAFRYLVNESLNRGRSLRARNAHEKHLDVDHPDLARDLHVEGCHDLLLADPDLVLDHCRDEVRTAFLQLGERERAAFLLVSLGDFRVREVAALLDAPLGTVLSLVFRARRRLRESLAAVAIDCGLLPREIQTREIQPGETPS